MTSCVQRNDVYRKKPPLWGEKMAEDVVFDYFRQSLTWDVRQELLPALFVMPGDQERTAKRSWLALSSECSLTVMRNRQAGRVPELSNLCKRKSLLSLAAPPGSVGALFGVIPILFTVWHMQNTICLHGSSQHF